MVEISSWSGPSAGTKAHTEYPVWEFTILLLVHLKKKIKKPSWCRNVMVESRMAMVLVDVRFCALRGNRTHRQRSTAMTIVIQEDVVREENFSPERRRNLSFFANKKQNKKKKQCAE